MWLDQSKLKNKAHAALPLELMITYMAKDDKGAVKAFLCKASKNGERVSVINDETTVDPTQKSDHYTYGVYTRQFTIYGD